MISISTGGISIGGDLGKRKNRWEDDSGGGVVTAGLGGKALLSWNAFSFPVRKCFHNLLTTRLRFQQSAQLGP